MAAPLTARPLPLDPTPSRLGVERRPDLVVLQGGRHPQPVAPPYARRRAVAALLLVVAGAAVGALLWAAVGAVAPDGTAIGSASAPAAAAAGPAEGGTVVVARSGDTLWTVVRRARPEGDIRAVVDQLSAEHGSALLQAGETVVVPG